MKIEIIESRIAHWDELFNQYPAEQRTEISSRRFKNPEDPGPDYLEVWEVTGDLAQHIQAHDSDWIVE
jgi:hypothetical protein